MCQPAKKGAGAWPGLQATTVARDRDSERADLRLKSNELAQSCMEAASVRANGFQSSGSNGTF